MNRKYGRRRRARIYALQALYAQQTTKYSLPLTLLHFWNLKEREPEVKSDLEELISDDRLIPEIKQFTNQLLQVTLDHLEEIDKLISETASHWDFDRIAMVDKNILRIAIGELLYVENIPPNVTIDEAIEIAKDFSSEKSSKFVNGVLDKIKTIKLEKNK